MSGLYQYKGKLTINEVARYEDAIKQAKEEAKEAIREAYLEVRQLQREVIAAERKNERLVTENMVLKESAQNLKRRNRSANSTIGSLETQQERLRETIQALRKDKRGLHSRIIGLKKVRPERRKPEPKPAPVIQITDYSGPQGLEAAADEAKRYYKARRAA